MAISWRLGSISRTSRCLCIFCSLVFFCFFCFGISNAKSVGTDIFPTKSTLTAGEVMKDDQSLLSPNRRFRLRFFSPDFTKYNRYLGIQIMNTTEVKIVWVANRENPLKDFSDGFFNITQEGNMVITDSLVTYFIFNSNQPAMSSSKASVTLLNSGNLVLTAGNQTVWQSFDYSSDTWLPGMKLGVVTGLKTGHLQNQVLTSWMSPEAPAAGAYTFGIDANHGKQLVVWERGVPYWRSGTKNGTEFSYLPDIVRDYFNFSYLSNENESYYTISPVGNIPYVWIVMNSSGALDMYVQMGDSLDQVYITNCIDKNEDISQGCVVPHLSNCKSGDDFLLTSGNMSEWDYSYMDNYSLSLNDCKVICMNNCSCTAYSSGESDGSGCRFSHGQKLDFVNDNSDAETFYLRNVTSLVPPKKRTLLWLIISTPVVSLVIVSLLCLMCYRGKRNYCCFGFKDTKRRNRSQGDTELVKNELGASIAAIDKLGGAHEEDLSGKKNHELHLFNFSSIQVATDHFSDKNKLGQGGFGPVYKGKLADGQEIAVKRLSRTSGQGLEEFKNEVILISKLQHKNLVRVLGCCIQGGERILIYEYLPNKSLDYFLFDAKKRALLDWKKRMSIIEGIAQGLLYLHKYSRLKIIHRDLKTSNILLDSNMNPKIADFGTARIFGEDESRANTNRIVGTYGYMSPEYAMDGLFSVKSDVFSFGVVMLEILSGKKNNGFYQSDQSLSLLGYVWDLWKGGRCLELMDQDLLDEICPIDDIMRCVHIGLLCVQENAVDRPTMSDVVSMLSHDLVPLPAPKQPAFSTVSSADASEDLPKNPRQCSMNRITVSEIEAR